MKGVYFINTPELKSPSLFKIGWSEDIKNRIKELQTGNGFKLNLYGYILTDNRSLETRIQKSLSQYRRHGEWFELTKSQVDRIVNCYRTNSSLNIDNLNQCKYCKCNYENASNLAKHENRCPSKKYDEKIDRIYNMLTDMQNKI